MKKEQLLFPLHFLLLILLLSILCLLISLLAGRFLPASEDVETLPHTQTPTVILDAGHGGEDGGAVSASGIYEKTLNLAFATQLQQLLCANGIEVIMTRETDTLLYDRNVDFQGRKKALDLAARLKIAERIPNSIFVSIHMNAYPLTQYSGLQVWYSRNHIASAEIAQQIQDTVGQYLQPENDRRIKAATSSIYLLHRIKSPAVLVECGFLSNPEEARLLDSPAYQKKLSLLLFLSLMQSITIRDKNP